MTTYFKQRLAEIKANPDLIAKPDKPHPRHRGYRSGRESAPTATGRLGWVYFIANHADNVVKIGFTTNRPARMSELQTGTHRKLSLECSIPAHESIERMLHQHFAKQRIRGEWFKLVWEIEELWDDLLDYQGMRCSTGQNRSGDELLQDMDERPVDPADLQVILKTIGKPWPEEFRVKLATGDRHG